ncbi:Signal transduction histidine kinase, core [Moorella glycerini]|uniref:histidine kinase n=1 Tax=Neomoorella stamsii TaxID=1266720 RepID=A0A9X7J119_9FIRM|nr:MULTISPECIES: HAMP domain-containing sensor histidine kinase [Moorella]PRR71269.1 Alkaline phosphatase synthesis sensor protein PhoR [Moorella stamsii]CEP66690.1 Signal transduction histidine kinase, core [Moorella glycerini]
MALRSLRWKIALNFLTLLFLTLVAAYLYLRQAILDALGLPWLPPFRAGVLVAGLEGQLLLTMLVILVVMIAGTFILSRGIIMPLTALLPLTQKIAGGDLEQRIEIQSNDEIGLLSHHLNVMVETLRNNFREMAEERNKMQAILASMSDALLTVDQVGRVMLLNPAAEAMFGKKGTEVEHKYLLEVIRNHEVDKLVKEILSSGMPLEIETRLFPTTNQLFKIYGAPILSAQKRVVGAALTIRDITNIRRLEQMRTEFVANVSHELRTPLTSIRGFVETLLEGALEDPEVSRRFLGIINKEAQRLQQLIEDLLALSRLENQPQRVRPGRAKLIPTLEGVLATVNPLAREKGVNLEVEIPEGLPSLAIGENYLSQVLLNLIDNSIKYTPAGGRVTVRAGLENDGIQVEVEDTGIGIPAESLPRVFERFYRVDKARSREMGGTGLGLAIVKHIVEAHDGNVGVTSQPGQGSRFFFTLPVVTEGKVQAESPIPEKPQN